MILPRTTPTNHLWTKLTNVVLIDIIPFSPIITHQQNQIKTGKVRKLELFSPPFTNVSVISNYKAEVNLAWNCTTEITQQHKGERLCIQVLLPLLCCVIWASYLTSLFLCFSNEKNKRISLTSYNAWHMVP